LRTSEVDDRVHRRADGASGEEYVVDQQDAPAVDAKGDRRPLDDGILHPPVEVVAIERDVDDAERDGIAPIDLMQDPPQALRDVDAARADSDQSQVLGAAAA